MVAVIIDRVRVHVSDRKGVDEETQESGDEEQHHGDVVDMDTKSKGNLLGHHGG